MTSKQEPDYRSFVNKPISPYLDDDDKKRREELVAYRAKRKLPWWMSGKNQPNSDRKEVKL